MIELQVGLITQVAQAEAQKQLEKISAQFPPHEEPGLFDCSPVTVFS